MLYNRITLHKLFEFIIFGHLWFGFRNLVKVTWIYVNWDITYEKMQDKFIKLIGNVVFQIMPTLNSRILD